MGYGTLSYCSECGEKYFCWQSCGNRNCPKCGNEKITRWLAKRQKEILPVDYFMVTFTLPFELRKLCRREPEKVYGALFKAASDSMKELALDKRFIGGKIGMMGSLHTWRRDGEFHPHLHFLVPGGAISPDGRYWIYPKKPDFLIAAKPLAKLFQGKFRNKLEELGLDKYFPINMWHRPWVVDIKNVGNGMASFKYLAPYMQRGFLGNNRIEMYDGEKVTFRYKDGQTKKTKYRTLSAMKFMTLYLQHVLPSGFQKTRYYGLLSSACKKTIKELKILILISRGQKPCKNKLEIFAVPPHHCNKCGGMLKISCYHARPPPDFEQRYE
jgi:predicted RNA-binding Zn-ribbon protein involved in translation (DUF1610 family)